MTKFLLIFSFLLFTTASVVEAHPGRTDGSGGHTCRTNCENWGLGYSEYHYHGGGGSSSGGSSGGSNFAPIQETFETQEVVVLPTATPYPTRIPTRTPTRIPTRVPTKIPTPTITVAVSPTTAPTPTVTKVPTPSKAIPVKAAVQNLNLVEKVIDFFQKLFRF
jgi:hypothetical protein